MTKKVLVLIKKSIGGVIFYDKSSRGDGGCGNKKR